MKTFQGDATGVSGILLDPSPVKVARPGAQVERPTTTESPASDDDELPDLANIDQKRPSVQNRSEPSDEDIRTPAASSERANRVLNFELLDQMLRTANHVGHTFHKDTQEWEAVRKVDKLFTAPGKRMNRALEKLKLLYEKLRDSIAADNSDGIQETHVEIMNLLHSIQEETDKILTNRLGNPALGIEFFDDVSTRSLLIDLYFNILPSLLKSMILGAEVYDENGSVKTPCLNEFADLVEVYYRLARAAIDQPKSSQPRPSQIPPQAKSINFAIIRPIQLVFSLMRGFRKTIKFELSSRAQVEKRRTVALERQRRQRRHLELERVQRQEKRRRKNEFRKNQRADLARQCQDPIWGPILSAEIARSQAAAEAAEALEELNKPNVRRTELVEPQLIEEEAEENLIEDDPYEQRVSIFGKNNRQQNGGQPWSDKKRTEFLDFLRANDGIVPDDGIIVRKC